MNVAHARVGSLEIVAALFAVAIVAARPRIRVAEEAGMLTPVQAHLRVLEVGNIREFEGTCPLVIGRGCDVQLVLADPEVSRRHARLETQDGTVFLRDLESSNGTFLNGRRLTSAIELREGDEVDVGTTRLVVEKLRPWT
ncbi:MAG: FHA domain-containing protein [Candidatus Eremiobacteraeota bacterium]|nr:FHA domain-containing protein [Candidatus Eremiobacteraeota bacterium]